MFKDRLGLSTKGGMSNGYYGEPPASRASTSNYLAGIHGNMRPTRLSSTPGRQIQDFRINHKRSLSPVRTAGLGSSMGPSNSSTQTSPALVNALFERVEQQAEMISTLSETVKIHERTQRNHAAEMKKMQDEIMILSDRLREKGVDLATERKLEQFRREVFGQLEMAQSEMRRHRGAADGGYQGHESGSASALVRDLHDSKRMLQDDNDALRREFDHLKTRFTKLELELQPTLSCVREIERKQDRLDRAVGSLTESQRSQSKSLSSVVDERDVYFRDLRQLRNAVDKLGRQVSELESDFSQKSVSETHRSHYPLSNGHVFDKEPKNLSRKSRPLENGDVKSGKKQQKNKSKSAGALLELGLSDSDADLSLTTLDLSSSSDSSFQLNKSLKEAGLHLDNLSSTSLSSLDSEDLLGGFPH